MADIVINDLSKMYGGKRVLDRVAMHIADGEFVAVLGPSGCGKTTLLRLLAGFETPDEGTIRLGDRIVSSREANVPPEKRHIGIVFQNYALWPHMSVADNVGYALKIAGASSQERLQRSRDALAVVGMENLAERAPSDLSGGQRQRVALARCLAAKPSVMLLDEPLANLDVHLRAAMENEFVRFHRHTGATMVYITHDQSEAMALADRIAVIDRGRLVQFDRPRDLYREPQSEMVARFIGNGQVLPVQDVRPEAEAAIVSLFGKDHRVRARTTEQVRSSARLSVHTSAMRLAQPGEDGFAGKVERVIYRGNHSQVDFIATAEPELQLTLHAPADVAIPADDTIQVCISDGWVIPAAA
ncbi:ABC transporter ATP-binding protein [Mesorhizobium sp. NPDC059054]|uniref:ABC transporter ATP-binding protein n=1 Tax=Mesorhizobium sp. NPDC059054 TaxID=3346711 RepID=UPI00367E8AC9